MNPDEVASLYDDTYASAYNARWLGRGRWQHDADFEEQKLGELLDRRVSTKQNDPRWLDVACGTGYFLSRFPGVKRAGIDISPAMLAEAERANPDALFLEKRDYRDPEPSWNGAWDLVSCMWWAYSYAGSMGQVETLIENLCDWTSAAGACFMPFCDIEFLTGVPDTQLPYWNPGDDSELWLTGFVWNWNDREVERLHKDLITFNRGHLLELFGRRFERVEVINYPPYQGENLRKALLATDKRSGSTPAPILGRTVTADPHGRPDLTSVLTRRGRYWRRRVLSGSRRRLKRLPVIGRFFA